MIDTTLYIAPQQFTYKPIATTPADKKRLLTAVATALGYLTKFEQEVSSTAQLLYQRTAQISYIERDHQKWAETLKSHFTALDTALNKLRTDIPYVGELDDPKQIAETIRNISHLEEKSRPLIKIYQELIIVLKSPIHQSALETYKTQKRQCRAISKIVQRDEKLNRLSDLVQTVAKTFSTFDKQPVIEKQETLLLYIETLQYIKYTATKFCSSESEQAASTGSWWWSWWTWQSTQPITVSDEELKTRVEALIHSVTEKEQKLTSELPIKRDAFEESNLVDDFLTDGDPPEDVDFRRSTFVYREMKPQIDALRKIAKGLADLHQGLQSNLYSGEKLKSAAVILRGLEARVDLQLKSLHTLPQTNKIHAGMYYASRLFTKARHVEIYLNHIKNLTSKSCTPCTITLEKTLLYLDVNQTVTGLFSALHAASSFKKPYAEKLFRDRFMRMLHDLLYTVLGRIGPKTVVLTESELTICDKILARAPLESFQPGAIFTYLMKGLVNKLYFLGDAIDPHFDITLTILMRDHRYEDGLKKILQSTDESHTLFTQYASASDFSAHEDTILKMGKVLDLLSRSGSVLDTFTRYCQVQYKLYELKAQNLQKQQKMRLDWLIETTKPKLEALKDREPYSDAFENLHQDENKLYRLILAEAEEKEILPLLPKAPPKDKSIRWIVYKWTLERLIKTGSLHPLLDSLFTEYLIVENVYTLWTSYYGHCFMELALYKCSQRRDKQMPDVWQNVVNKREQCDYKFLENILKIYDRSRTAEDQEKKACIAEAKAEIDLYQNNPETPNVRIARLCFNEMKLKASKIK